MKGLYECGSVTQMSGYTMHGKLFVIIECKAGCVLRTGADGSRAIAVINIWVCYVPKM